MHKLNIVQRKILSSMRKQSVSQTYRQPLQNEFTIFETCQTFSKRQHLQTSSSSSEIFFEGGRYRREDGNIERHKNAISKIYIYRQHVQMLRPKQLLLVPHSGLSVPFCSKSSSENKCSYQTASVQLKTYQVQK